MAFINTTSHVISIPFFSKIQEIFFGNNVLKNDVEHAIRLENHRKDIT